MDDVFALMLGRQYALDGRARRLRVAAGLSCAEVGDAVGRSGSAVSLWETGKRMPHGPSGVAYGQLLAKLDASSPLGTA